MKRKSTEAHVYMGHHQGAKVKHFSNVIYHKFSHGAVSYTLNGENGKALLEFCFVYYSASQLGQLYKECFLVFAFPSFDAFLFLLLGIEDGQTIRMQIANQELFINFRVS